MPWEEPGLLPDKTDKPDNVAEAAPPFESAASPGPVGPATPVGSRPGMNLFWWLSFAVLAIDQGSKALVRQYLHEFDSVTIIPNLVDFTHVQNNCVAFGILSDSHVPFKSGVTSALAVVALIGIWLYARHVRREEWLARWGLSLILGGAVGNLIDRLRVGAVVDFVDVYWRTWHFWAFNVADASITIGAILVFLDLLLVPRHASDPV
jgi:signal peptidase II